LRRWETITVFAPLVVGVSFLAWALASTYYENKARDAPAIAAGFADATEMNAAKAIGMTNPAAYRARELSANNHTRFDTIPANGKKAFKEVNVGFVDSQSATASCNIDTAKRTQTVEST
jgi:hypothetical protein